MDSKELVLRTMREYGKNAALAVQEKASEMTGTELYDNSNFIPRFLAACKKDNMLKRKIGFVCLSPQGRVVELLQPYDSTIYTDEPEKLVAQWRFKWSQNPKHAKPFVCIAESYYRMGDCCIAEDGTIRRSKLDVNVYDPMVNPEFWEIVEVTE